MTTADNRKAIPLRVKLQVLVDQARCAVCGEKLGSIDNIQFDHRPPLVARKFDPATGDFDPPQNDPKFLQAVHDDCHLYLTTGRKGEKKITSRGSDIGEAARVKRLEHEHEEFRRRILRKDTPEEQAAETEKIANDLLSRNGFTKDGQRKESRWPKRKLQSRSSFQTRRA